MAVNLSYLENRVDTSTAETARITLGEAAIQARLIAAQLDHDAETWRAKAHAATDSVHRAAFAIGFHREATWAEQDADAVRATAAAWEQQAALITEPTGAAASATPQPPDWANRLEHGLADARRTPINRGNDGGTKEQVTLPDGTKVFHKYFTPDEKNARHKVDAEELTALVGKAVAAPVPRVHRRGGELGVYVEWVDGAALPNARRRPDGKARAEAMLNSPAAQRLGLLDILTKNHDRHENNLRATIDDELHGIDHGNAWTGAQFVGQRQHRALAESQILGFMQGPGARHFVDPQHFLKFGPNPLTPGDILELRRRLSALRPAFSRRGRDQWLDASLHILGMITPHAVGTRPLVPEQHR